MSDYLATYGVDEERRGRVIKRIVIACVAVLVALIILYFVFHNYPERQKAKQFLSDINRHDYKAAYTLWGCTEQTPCPNYDFNRFMQDWGVKTDGKWKVASTDSCKTFLTLNVKAPGTELESIAVQRSDHSLSFAPAPECQEPKWHWKAFFHRIFGHGEKPPPPPAPTS